MKKQYINQSKLQALQNKNLYSQTKFKDNCDRTFTRRCL